MEVSLEVSSEEGSSLSRNPKQTRKTHAQFTTHQQFPNSSDSCVPVLRRSLRLLAKQKSIQDRSALPVGVSRTLDTQQANIKPNSSNSSTTLRRSLRSQSTSSTVSSCSSGGVQTSVEDNTKTRKRKRVNSPFSLSPPRKQPRKGNKKSEVTNNHCKGSNTKTNRDTDCALSECESQCEAVDTKKTGPSKQRQTKANRNDKDSSIRRGKRINNSNTSVEAGSSPVKRQKRKTKVSDIKEILSEESTSSENTKRGRKGKESTKTASLKGRGKGKSKEESISAKDSSPTRTKKGKASLKSKGRKSATSEKGKSCSSKHFYSLPSFHELAKLNMASEENTDQQVVPQGESNTASGVGIVSSNVGEGGLGGSSGSSGDQSSSEGSANPLDPFPMNEENRRLHAMLEARGLPPHLLGALGSKMHYILHKSMSSSMSSSNNSRAQQLLSGIETMDDEGLQLQSCIEMGQLLVMGNEDTLSGFPVKQAVPALINLLTLEHNFDMMMNACRALTYMMEALPRSTVVVADAIPVLIEKLQVIQCMDVAEQAISALNLLSKRHGKAILQAGGLNACLLYLDFFSIATQRSALSVAANCCQSVVSEDDFPLVADALPILSGRLQHQDKRSVECCCLCFSRLIENYFSNPKILKVIASQSLLSNLQQLLVISPPVINSSTFVTVLRMLSNLCISCPSLAVDLLKLNMADTLRYLLLGPGEITLENIELTARSPNEVYEILSLASSLMPPLPKDGVFEVEEMINLRRYAPTTVQWEWQGDGSEWKPYGRIENRILEAAHQSHEEECSIAVNGNVYIIDFASSQQVNEDTGNSRAIRRTVVDLAALTPKKDDKHKQLTIEDDARAVALRDDPSLGRTFVEALFGALYEVFNSMAGPGVRNKCLKTILRILYHTDHEILAVILKEISISSLIATMLKAQDYRVIIGGLQMADILMRKLPDIFVVYFHREGVMHQLQTLKNAPLKVVATPKQEVATPIATPPQPVTIVPITSESSQTPTSTRKRLSDIFRKGKRHFRKTLRGRTDDSEAGPSQPPTLLPRGAEGNSLPVVPVVPPDTKSGASGKTPEEGSSGTSSEQPSSSREYLQKWIQQQSNSFLEKWSEPASAHPALSVVKKLNEASQDLNPESQKCVDAAQALCSILLDPSSNVSAFEFMHCKLHTRLMRYLTVDSPECVVPLNTRLRQFVHIFMGLPEEGVPLASWSPSHQVGLIVLLQKLHGCVNQLEQFPVKVHDLPGRRGSQALKFFNSHHIKCVLERHPSATGTSQWKGGPLRIEPLATVQTLERYLMIRGFGRHEHISRRLEELENDDSEDDVLVQLQGVPGISSDKHSVEFLIGDHVLPYNMTVFQAIRQFSLGSTQYEGEEELVSLGRPEIWIRSHTIHYRNVQATDSSGAGPSTSLSLPSTPLSETRLPSSSRKPSWSTGSNVRRRAQSAKFPLPSSGVAPRITRSSSGSRDKLTGPPVPQRVTRSSTSLTASASKTNDDEVPKEKSVQLSPLYQALLKSVKFELVLTDPSLPVLKLLTLLNALNNHWTDLYPGLAGNPILPASEFTNNKLTAKVTRQLQDPLNVMTGNFPVWMRDLAIKCPCLFPFECRQMLFYLTSFDRDRAIARLQEQQPDLSNTDSSQTVTPRFDKKVRCVSRDNLLEQAEKLLNDVASSKALLEIRYEDEVGTGLGPTLEFYTLASRELQRSDLMLFRGDNCPVPGAPQGASSVPQYIHSPVGLFPMPLGPSTRFSIVEEVCAKFRFLGKLMAKSIVDSRMLDIPLSEAFYKWMLGSESTFTAQDLQHVDPVLANSFAQLAAVAVKKHTLESDPLLTGKALAIGIESLTMEGGGSIEDLDVDFTLPGYPDIELKPGGKDIQVTIHNLDDYLKLVVDWTLHRGVARQMESFKEGFNSVFSLSSMRGLFYPSEMDMVVCGAHHQKWDIKELMDCCRPDHGYSHDSKAVQFLFEVLSTYDTAEQRQFVQFVTGSPRLPVGGFKALNPPLTIVRKTVESPHNPDDFLPSVMTCVNYLKLPDYSSYHITRDRLHFALREGKHSFHLS